MQQLINPPGSAYRSETGGLMEALRVLTVEQSKSYVTYLTALSDNLLHSSELS